MPNLSLSSCHYLAVSLSRSVAISQCRYIAVSLYRYIDISIYRKYIENTSKINQLLEYYIDEKIGEKKALSKEVHKDRIENLSKIYRKYIKKYLPPLPYPPP